MKSARTSDTNIKYILTQPARLSNITLDELEDDDNYAWREKARKLQARRWRRIKHQLA
ncbi:MAG TPA: hypothetical protein VFT49_01590 [Candidatus Saccharimonadales bacterium]|nr:hypothetical protein [Candidatus Saccharimonadales bacterium]